MARVIASRTVGTMTCECRPVLVSWPTPMLWKRRQMQQHGKARRPFHERANGGTVQTDDEIAFPVAWDSTILNHGRTFAD